MKAMSGRFIGKLESISTKKQRLLFEVTEAEDEKDYNLLSGKEVGSPIGILKGLELVEDGEEMEENSWLESEKYSSLSEFEDKFALGGSDSDSVILYTTSLRGIRKTFEDCNTIRFLLESFRVVFDERDVSMHMEFRDELWRIMGGRVIPPKLFIKGRLIGGVDEVVELNEQGKLHKLLGEVPKTRVNGPCIGCAGVRFLVCCQCNGSRKVIANRRENESITSCVECNENGLVKCSICC